MFKGGGNYNFARFFSAFAMISNVNKRVKLSGLKKT